MATKQKELHTQRNAISETRLLHRSNKASLELQSEVKRYDITKEHEQHKEFVKTKYIIAKQNQNQTKKKKALERGRQNSIRQQDQFEKNFNSLFASMNFAMKRFPND